MRLELTPLTIPHDHSVTDNYRHREHIDIQSFDYARKMPTILPWKVPRRSEPQLDTTDSRHAGANSPAETDVHKIANAHGELNMQNY